MASSRFGLSAVAGVSALLVVVVAATIAALLGGGLKRQGEVPSPSQQQIDPALQLYRQTATFSVELKEPRGLAVIDQGRVAVVGDQALLIYGRDGQLLRTVLLQQPPQCVAAGGASHIYPERIYIGFRNHVEVFDAAGNRLDAWNPPRDNSDFTSITAAQRDVFVADVASRLVWRYNTEGQLLGSLGAADKSRNYPGFVITSRYFDAAASSDGMLYAVNPRLLRIEGFDYSGHNQGNPVRHWGRGSPQLDGFFGCCNPIHLAAFPDGRFATAEKGFNWVKIYSRSGQLECVVAGPAELAAPAADLAVDEENNVWVLDAAAKCVRVFGPKNSGHDNGKSQSGL